MKRLVLHDKKVWTEDCPDPTPEREWVVVKVEATPICGSDKKAYFSNTPVRTSGHEGAGVVVATAGSSRLREGDRVILNPLSGCGVCELCRTGNYIYCKNKPPFDTHFAQYLKVQDFVCSPLPDDISYEIGSLACCALSPAFNAIKRLNVKGFDTLLVMGLGPVGMGAVTIAKFLGARVIAVDSVPFRKSFALDMGADTVLDAFDEHLPEKIREAAKGIPLKKAVDTSGNGAAERTCIDMMEPGGAVAFIGENQGEIPIYPSKDFIRKGLTLMGAWHYNLNDHSEMMSILRNSPVVSRLITDVYGFGHVQEAFDKFIAGATCKVMLKPFED